MRSIDWQVIVTAMFLSWSIWSALISCGLHLRLRCLNFTHSGLLYCIIEWNSYKYWRQCYALSKKVHDPFFLSNSYMFLSLSYFILVISKKFSDCHKFNFCNCQVHNKKRNEKKWGAATTQLYSIFQMLVADRNVPLYCLMHTLYLIKLICLFLNLHVNEPELIPQ